MSAKFQDYPHTPKLIEGLAYELNYSSTPLATSIIP